ncbi:MAG: glycosyltransferase family 39 protein, partial [Anaerolineae bacterium]|nr:glycosyltransferase family 39 protein [Anaerolineae bacterium]
MEPSTTTPPAIASATLNVGRKAQARGLAGLSVACLIASAIGFMPQNQYLLLPTILLLAGGVSLGAALGLRRDWGFPRLERITRVEADRRVRWISILIGAALLALLGLRGGKFILPMQVYQLTNIHVQMVMLFGGLALVVGGVGGVRRQDAAAFAACARAHRREIGLMLALIVIAFAVRMINLQDAVRAFMDEGPFVEAVVKMREDPLVPLTAPLHPVASSTRLFPYVQMVLSDLFGSNLAMFRMGAVLFGALTIAATYALARVLFDQRTALLAGVLLAVFPPHIHMSRIGIYNIADPLFGVLALAFFTRAVQTQRRLFYALAGAMLGLLPYVYEGGELLFPPLVLLWAGWLALSKGPRPTRRGIGWMLLVALLLALPVYYTNLSYHLPLFTRLDDASTGGDYLLALLVAPNGLHRVHTFLAQRLLPPLLHYVHAPDASLFYGGETALILPWLVPLFLLGLFHALRRSGSGLLVLWVLLTTLGNSVILFNNWTARFVVVMPAIAILCAAGLRYT